MMCRLRMGVVWEQNEIGHGKACAWCGEQPQCWTEHVLDGCEVFRGEEGVCVVVECEEQKRGGMMDLLEDWGSDNVHRLAQRVQRFRSRESGVVQVR